MTSPQPLMPVRIITPMSSPLKRKADAPSGTDTPSLKAKRHMATLAPIPDDEHNDEEDQPAPKRLYSLAVPSEKSVFKVPSIPERTRLATPASSTVVASSSPQRALASSEIDSPTRAEPETIASINLADGELILFGRHHGAWNASEPVELPSSKAVEAYLDTSLPRRAFNLPRTAKMASRCHAAIQAPRAGEYGGDGKYRVVVFGQNGVRIRFGGVGKFKRMRAGLKKDVSTESEIDFGNCIVRVLPPTHDVYPLSSPSAAERLLADSLSPPPSLPPSSPPIMPIGLAEMDEEDSEHDDAAPAPRSRHVSPLFDDAKSAPSLVRSNEPASATAGNPVQSEHVDAHADEVTRPEEPIPADVDLPAILANTVVFSGSSKLSLPDLVRHMLETAPSMKQQASEAQWRVWAGKVLEEDPMFGKVQRNGKDASGHPLLPHYFYSPDTDTDASRAKELGGLVRPLRAAQRAGGKPLDWRPVGSGRRRY